MEAFAVPADVVLDLRDSGKRKRRPPEHVEQLVTKARHVGPHAAAMEYNLTAPKDLLISSETGSSVGICGDFFVLRVVPLWVAIIKNAIIKNAIIKNAKGTVFKFDRF